MLNRELKRIFRRMGKTMVERDSYGSTADENAVVRGILDRAWVDGRIGFITDGMDCDCTKYHHERVIELPNSVQALKRYVDRHIEWLDGPESQRFVRPDQIDRSADYSRDLALEAFEDGHPHVVYI